MRIDSLGRPTGALASARPGASSGSFSVSDVHRPDAARTAAPLRAAPPLDALMALQAYEELGPRERRRREIARGRSLLDALDGMKLALIDGRDDRAALASLAAELDRRRGSTGETGLDDALDAIELRAKVELAKRGG